MKCFLLDVFFQLSCSTVCIKQDSKWEDFALQVQSLLMYHCCSTGKLNASLRPYLCTYKYICVRVYAPTQILFSVFCTFYKALLFVKHVCIKFKFTWSVSNTSNMISFVVTICHATTKVIFYLQQKGKSMHSINKNLLSLFKITTVNTIQYVSKEIWFFLNLHIKMLWKFTNIWFELFNFS